MSPFDAYRDAGSRQAMIEFVMSSRSIDKPRAVTALRELDHVGLAHVYQDATAAAARSSGQVDYDPCVIGRV